MSDDNVQTLVVLHYVYAGINALVSCCGVCYVTFIMGLLGLSAAQKPNDVPPGILGLGAIIWLVLVVVICALTILNFLCAGWLRNRKNWMGVVVVSALNCLHLPLGAALGVFTLIVISRPYVRQSFHS